jgi:RimJ/RimL family protein N-acetyltransferase
MPKMPQSGRQQPAIPLVTPLAAARLKPVFVDRWSEHHRVLTLKPQEVTPGIAEWLTAAEVMEGLNAPRAAMGLDAFRAYVASFDNLRRNLFAIRRRSDDAPLGLIMLEIDLRHKVGSLHIVIGDADNRNMGVAIDASAIVARHFFLERKMEKLTFQPLARNTHAVEVCRKSGLVLEGTLRSHRIDGRTGERLDQMVFGITRGEFLERETMAAEPGFAASYDGPGIAPADRRSR